jgi:hypothetical protein
MAANFYDSALLGFQGRVKAGLNANELREKDTAVLSYALDNQKYFETIMNINEIKQSVQRPVYGYYFNRNASTNGSAMTDFPTGSQGSSAQQALTFVTFTEEFQTFNVTGMDNVYDFAAIFDNQAKQAMRNIRTRVREWLTSNLYTNRTTVLPYGVSSILNATFDSATDAYTISSPQPYSAMTSVMRQAGYGSSTYDALLDPILYPQYQYTYAQGNMNAANLNYQFDAKAIQPAAGGYFDNVWEDLNLNTAVSVTGGYNLGCALVMPKNSFCFVPWMPELYYSPNSSKSFDQYVGGYGTIGDDMYANMEYQIFGWNNQSDTSGSYGYGQSQTQNWQIGFTAAFVTSYLSNSGETPIYFFALTA